ncbi:MAG TPA: AMP-binding protein, partial [Gammaproteobacteria bacterium]
MQDWTEDLIPVETAGTLPGLFRERVRRSPQRPAYRWFERSSGQWRTLDWAGMGERVARWRAALAEEGLLPGERVAIQLRNGVEWVCFDQAAQSLGLVVVPLYVEDRPDNVAYILQDAHCRLLLVQSEGHWRRVAEAVGGLDFLQRVLLLDTDTPAV